MIRKSLLLTAWMLAISLLLAGLFLILIIDEKPSVQRQVVVTPEHIERAKKTFDQYRQQAKQKLLSSIKIQPEDIDIAANYLAKHFINGDAHISMSHQQASIQASLPLPLQAPKGYINLEATVIETDALPQLQSVRIGHIPIPDFVSQFLVSQSIQWLQNQPKYRNGIEAIKFVQIAPDALNVLYQWQGKFSLKIDNHFPVLSKSEQEKVYRYHLLLTQNYSQQANQTLSQILQPLMQMAARYSADNQAQKENRAAILAATLYIVGLPLKYLIPEAVDWPRPHNQSVTLDGRQDFAQHFIVSAAITAYADTALSDAIGLYKEIEDKRSGSGFSFNDIAADRAGTRFGERATASQKEAVRLQQLIAQGLDDSDLMPAWTDLPEHLSKNEFRQHYGNFDTPAYHQTMEKIERRVEILPFLN
ncbi:hypothetical protein [Nitrosomonas sp.]|uniref:hypothetical protein n=1 Tax=Nitrosomonas sp. TaxID=42353 RepID=UPI002088C5CC|nr:hypothetical protein [Nitrosomonas sp.]GJL76379.1 MAG: hypothetical protein NMNS02_24850 [Nitrosomonas sp.]